MQLDADTIDHLANSNSPRQRPHICSENIHHKSDNAYIRQSVLGKQSGNSKVEWWDYDLVFSDLAYESHLTEWNYWSGVQTVAAGVHRNCSAES
jgi:hypothetical protein